jgi:hypothetical protein
MNRFDEYKFFAERTLHLSDRRQTATQTYLTVNAAIFTVLAFLAKDLGLHGWSLVIVTLPLFLVGIVACIIWHRLITQYKPLISWHYEQLREIEASIPESHHIFQKEWGKFYQPHQGKERFGFSITEVWLPRLFLGLYAVYGIGLVGATLLGYA